MLNAVAAELPPRYGVPTFDVIGQTIAAYPGFVLGMTISLPLLEAAAAIAVPGDPTAQAWAVQAVETLNELYILSQIPGETEAFDFSVMEALFARGFTSREEVLDLPFADFQQALTGTIAYDHAAAIYANAGAAACLSATARRPVRADQSRRSDRLHSAAVVLTAGPVAYLHEMLKVSERSTCDRPLRASGAGPYNAANRDRRAAAARSRHWP